MTIILDVEVGDKVQFKAKLPGHIMVYQHERVAEDGELLEEQNANWSHHFGGLHGLVDCVDIQQQLVRVRGKDNDGNDYTVWIEPRFLNITRRGMDFSV
jgi:hypothetical protein